MRMMPPDGQPVILPDSRQGPNYAQPGSALARGSVTPRPVPAQNPVNIGPGVPMPGGTGSPAGVAQTRRTPVQVRPGGVVPNPMPPQAGDGGQAVGAPMNAGTVNPPSGVTGVNAGELGRNWNDMFGV